MTEASLLAVLSAERDITVSDEVQLRADKAASRGSVTVGVRRLVALALFVVTLAGIEILCERHYYSRTYNYYQAAEVYWEEQSTLLLYLPHRFLFWTLKPNIRLKAAENAQGYGLRPGQNVRTRYEWEIRVGPKGFRGPDFPARKPAGELRVACFGDSRTLGEALAASDTYPRRLEA